MAEQQAGMTIQVLSPKEYAFLISILHAQHQRGELSAEDYATLLQAFTVMDLDGAQWIFAPETGEWLHVDGDDWEAGEPRGPLLLALPAKSAAEVHGISEWLRVIEAGLPSPRPPSAYAADQPAPALQSQPEAALPPKPAAAPPILPVAWAFCIACGSQLKPGAAYCSKCGKRVAAEPR